MVDLLFQIQILGLLIFCKGDQEFVANILFVLFCNIIQIIRFLYCFTIFLHLIFSFSLIKSSLIPYAYVSDESIDCILLLSFELKATLIIYSVKTSYLLLLNLCCIFNINLMFVMNSSYSI